MPLDPTPPPWAATLLGKAARVVEVFGGGTSRTTLLLEVPPTGRRLVARHDSGSGPLSATGFTLAREAAVADAVARAGLPAPRSVALAADERSIAVEELAGETETGAVALDDYLAVLGRLHLLDVDRWPDGHPGLDAAGIEDLALWEAATRAIGTPVPVLDAAFDRLRRDGAARPDDVVLCHGDAGAGNYLHDGATVTGLVDWEMAHTGDPHDDLASVAVRATLSGIDLGDYRGRIERHWEPVAGRTFDDHRYRRSVVGVLARMVVSCHAALAHADPETDRSVQLMGLPLMEVQLVRAMAALDGSVLPSVDDPRPDRAQLAAMAQLVAEGIGRDLVPRARGADAPRARRLRYIADQLADALHADGGTPRDAGPEVAGDLDELWRCANRRLAALPASRPLAHAPIPGTI